MELIQIGQKPVVNTVTVREMFEKLAQREAEFIRTAREEVLALNVQRAKKASH